MKEIKIISPPPGPIAKKVIEENKKWLSPAHSRIYNFVPEEAKGCFVRDVDGNTYLDFTAGIAVCNAGWGPPEVVKAIKNQVEKLLYSASGSDYFNEPMVKLAKVLCELFDGRMKMPFLCQSGTEAIEGSLKLARYYTRKPWFIGFLGSFHGRTFGSLAFTSSKSKYRKHYAPMLNPVHLIPYPYCYRCYLNQEYPRCNLTCLDYLIRVLETAVPAEDTAAILVEPIQGEGGYIVPPKDFLIKLSKICRSYSILLILDEIQTGFGRTGKMFAFEHTGIAPDIVCLAKALGAGMPIGAFIAKEEIMNSWSPGVHANTYGGNPLSAVAAIEQIKLIKERNLADNAAKMGHYLLKRLRELKDEYMIIGDVRGKGLMTAIELVKSRESKKPNPDALKKVMVEGFKKGLLMMPCGTYDNVLRLMPPLIITEDLIDRGITILSDVIKPIDKMNRL